MIFPSGRSPPRCLGCTTARDLLVSSLFSDRPLCHDCSFHLHRPTRGATQGKLGSLWPDLSWQLRLLLHPGVGGLCIHLYQRPHVPDTEEAQIDTRSSVDFTTVQNPHSDNHFVYNHFFVVFLANILFPLKAKKREEFLHS